MKCLINLSNGKALILSGDDIELHEEDGMLRVIDYPRSGDVHSKNKAYFSKGSWNYAYLVSAKNKATPVDTKQSKILITQEHRD